MNAFLKLLLLPFLPLYVVDDKVVVDADVDEDPKKKEETDDKKVDPDAKKEEEEPEEKKKLGIKIPKERLDQEIRKRRAAEARADERIRDLESQITAQKKATDVEGLEREVDKLENQLDTADEAGDKVKVKEIRANIRKVERQIARAEGAQQAIAAKQAAVSEIRYDMAVSQVELDYPELNPDDEENYDALKAEEVMDLLDGFRKKGADPSQALKRAARYVLGTPQRAEDTAEALLKRNGEGLRRQREEEGRRKAADVLKKSPPDTSKVGLDGDKKGGGEPSGAQIAKMSQTQFAKLDEDTLKKMRGDEV